MAVTFVDLISLPDISSTAAGLPGVAGAPTVAPGVFDDKLQDGLALAGALAVAASPTPLPTPAAPPAPDIDVTVAPAATRLLAGEVPPVSPAAVDTDALPGRTEATAATPTSIPAQTGPVLDSATTMPEPASGTPATTTATTTAATTTAATTTAAQTTTLPAAAGAALVGAVAGNTIDDRPASPTAAGSAVPLDAVATGSAPADTSLARRLLGGLRRGHTDQRAAAGDPAAPTATSPDAPATDPSAAATDAATHSATRTATDPTVPTDTAANGNDPNAVPTDRTTAHAAPSGTAVDTGASAGPEGASGTGQFHTDKVRYLRDLAPAREIQRLAVDLDDARVAVRFGAGATTVDVVSDPSSRLDAGWVSSVEKTLRQLDTAATPPTGGSRDNADARDGGQDRSMHDERRRRALEDATQRRWHDATETSRED